MATTNSRDVSAQADVTKRTYEGGYKRPPTQFHDKITPEGPYQPAEGDDNTCLIARIAMLIEYSPRTICSLRFLRVPYVGLNCLLFRELEAEHPFFLPSMGS